MPNPITRRGGKILRGPDGKITRNTSCCCDECNCAENGPTADFSYEITSGTGGSPGCEIQLTDESIAGGCGEIVSREWFDIGDEEPFSTDQNPTYTLDDDVTTITLTVTDAAGCQDSVSMPISCCDCEENGPTADFHVRQEDHDPDCCYSFFNDSVNGPCGSELTYEWDFGDGNFSTDENPTHCYSPSSPGDSWDVTLTVTDESGCTDSVTMHIVCFGDSGCCHCYEINFPDAVQVVLSGITGPCSFANGTYILDQRQGTCSWRTSVACGGPTDGPYFMQLIINATTVVIQLTYPSFPFGPCGFGIGSWGGTCEDLITDQGGCALDGLVMTNLFLNAANCGVGGGAGSTATVTPL